MKYLHEKIVTFYRPGALFFIFEEASLFHSVLGWQKKDIIRFENIVHRIINVMNMEDKLVILPMSEMQLATFEQWTEEDHSPCYDIHDSIIYAMMMSCETGADQALAKRLYVPGKVDYEFIKREYSHLWQEAYKRASYVQDIMSFRKSLNLWDKNIQKYFCKKGVKLPESNFVDSVVTRKNGGRLSLDMGVVLPNHGMPVLSKDGCAIVPEYRLLNSDVHPVKAIDDIGEFTFLYQ
jgi:hypothetical protein